MGTKVRQTQDPHRSWLLGKFPLNIKGLRIKLDNKCEVPIRVVRTWGLPGGPVVSSAFTAGVPGSICGRALRSHKSHDAAKKKKKRTSLVAQWIRILLLMQGTQVQFLAQEDPTCCRATTAARHNF